MTLSAHEMQLLLLSCPHLHKKIFPFKTRRKPSYLKPLGVFVFLIFNDLPLFRFRCPIPGLTLGGTFTPGSKVNPGPRFVWEEQGDLSQRESYYMYIAYMACTLWAKISSHVRSAHSMYLLKKIFLRLSEVRQAHAVCSMKVTQ